MSKKVFIGAGHGGNDSGAVGYIKEKDANLVMALACRDYLQARGVNVKMSRTHDENDPVSEEIRECNAYSPDLAIDCHNNAGGGDGFEAIHSIGSSRGKKLAQCIESEVKKIGQNSRGVKTRANSRGGDYFGFVRDTKCPAVILEGVFVDNKTDVKIADTKAEQQKFGVAYAKGILAYLGIDDKEAPANKPSGANGAGFLVKVIVDELNVRAGAGVNNKINTVIKDRGTYTIVETKNGWGKLKSGAGWINISDKYCKRI